MAIPTEGKTSYGATVPAQHYWSRFWVRRREVPKLDGSVHPSSRRQPAPIRTQNWRRNPGVSQNVFGRRRRREIPEMHEIRWIGEGRQPLAIRAEHSAGADAEVRPPGFAKRQAAAPRAGPTGAISSDLTASAAILVGQNGARNIPQPHRRASSLAVASHRLSPLKAREEIGPWRPLQDGWPQSRYVPKLNATIRASRGEPQPVRAEGHVRDGVRDHKMIGSLIGSALFKSTTTAS